MEEKSNKQKKPKNGLSIITLLQNDKIYYETS